MNDNYKKVLQEFSDFVSKKHKICVGGVVPLIESFLKYKKDNEFKKYKTKCSQVTAIKVQADTLDSIGEFLQGVYIQKWLLTKRDPTLYDIGKPFYCEPPFIKLEIDTIDRHLDVNINDWLVKYSNKSITVMSDWEFKENFSEIPN